MSTPKTDKVVAQEFEAMLAGLGTTLSEDRQPVIGNIAYLYVRCARFRKLLDDLLSKSPVPELREAIEMDLYTVLAEIQNIQSTTTELKDELESILVELPGDSDRG